MTAAGGMDALKALHSLGLGGETTGPEGDKLLKQAQHVWSMLDDMAAKDPQAYARFIEKQKKEYHDLRAPPEPHMCVKTELQVQGTPLFVNIVSWSQVPKPKSAEDSVPLYGAPVDNFKDKKAGVTVSSIAVAVNPEVLADCGLEAKDADERRSFINLTLDYVQHLLGAPVSRNFAVLPQSTLFKGDLEKAQKFFTDSLKKAMKKDKGQKEDPPAPDVDLPDSMISRLANIAMPDSQTSQSNGSSHKLSAGQPISLPETMTEKVPSKKNLIQELGSDEVKLKEPKYALEKSSSGDGLVLKVELPAVSSVSQCQLDISEDDVKLYVEGKYELTVKLPSCIDDCEARAKFSKKQSVLTLDMPLKGS